MTTADATPHNMVTLAQQGSSDAVFDVVLWVIVLIIAVVVLGVVLMQLRRIMRESDDSQSKGLMLDDLRKLRNEGHLSPEEYQRAVDAIAQRMGSPGSVDRESQSAE